MIHLPQVKGIDNTAFVALHLTNRARGGLGLPREDARGRLSFKISPTFRSEMPFYSVLLTLFFSTTPSAHDQ